LQKKKAATESESESGFTRSDESVPARRSE
jgi:hypothetical protein